MFDHLTDALADELRAAREERDEAVTDRWRATQELERKTASFDKEIAEAVADIERIAAERDEASRLAKDRLTVIGAIREEQARLRHLAADETEQLRGELHQMRDHSAADLETIRNLRAALARAEQATTAARQRVLAICDEMAGGPERGCSGYADEIRDALAADVPAAADPEALAQRFHEAYERLAPSFGYETREASAKPWAEVPENNRRLMTAVCAEILAADVPAAARRTDPTETGSESESPQVNARRTASDLPGMWETADLTGGQTDTAATRPSYRAFLGESPCSDPDCPCHPKHAPAAVVDPAGQTGGVA